jgi:hypothetical protein
MKKTGSFVKSFAVNNPVTTVAIVGVTGFVLYRVGKKFFGSKPNVPIVPPIPPPPPKPQDNPTGTKGQTQYTFGAQQYTDFADLLHDAMYPLGTNHNQIQQTLQKLKTYDDVLALIDAYGKRSLREWYGLDSDPYSLSQSFYADMSPEYIQKYVNDPLKRTGYKF